MCRSSRPNFQIDRQQTFKQSAPHVMTLSTDPLRQGLLLLPRTLADSPFLATWCLSKSKCEEKTKSPLPAVRVLRTCAVQQAAANELAIRAYSGSAVHGPRKENKTNRARGCLLGDSSAKPVTEAFALSSTSDAKRGYVGGE